VVAPRSWQPPERRRRLRRLLGLLADGWRAWQDPGMSAHCYLVGPGAGRREAVGYTALLAWERRGWVRRHFLRCGEGGATERREWVLTERGREWVAEREA